MNSKVLITFGILIVIVLVSGCIDNYKSILPVTNVSEIPLSSSPYTHQELREITKFSKDTESINISDIVFITLQPEIKTFTGEKYSSFSPTVVSQGKSRQDILDSWRYELLFIGNGYVDSDYYDSYYIRFYYKNNNVTIIERAIASGGVPKVYRDLGESIARQEKDIMNKTPNLDRVYWIPEKYAHVELHFSLPSMIPEHPMTTITVNLSSKAIVDIQRGFW